MTRDKLENNNSLPIKKQSKKLTQIGEIFKTQVTAIPLVSGAKTEDNTKVEATPTATQSTAVEYSASVAPTSSGGNVSASPSASGISVGAERAQASTAQPPTGDWNASLSDLKAQLADIIY